MLVFEKNANWKKKVLPSQKVVSISQRSSTKGCIKDSEQCERKAVFTNCPPGEMQC